jgi:hypothetical protein
VKRSRRGGRRPQHNGGNNGGGGFNPNRSFDSNGPEVKIRGSATQVYEKYLQLARDANSAGDRVMAENYLQHAEHYFRIMAAQAQAQQQHHQQNPQAPGAANGGRTPGPGEQGYVQAGASGATFSLTDQQGDGTDEEENEEAGAE